MRVGQPPGGVGPAISSRVPTLMDGGHSYSDANKCGCKRLLLCGHEIWRLGVRTIHLGLRLSEREIRERMGEKEIK